MNKHKNVSRKGFSLIELIIVLAVMAIIALIAIPNFTAVRDNSKNKADKQSMEVIKRILLVAETDVELPQMGAIDIHYDKNDIMSLSCNFDITSELEGYLKAQFNGVNRPQGNSTLYDTNVKATAYRIELFQGNITVGTYRVSEAY